LVELPVGADPVGDLDDVDGETSGGRLAAS
jgi:hypothetical protein